MGKPSRFQEEHSFEQRQLEAQQILDKYPDRIPVIVERAGRSNITEVDKKKYLIPAELTVGQFVYVIRKRIRLAPEHALYVYVDDNLPPTSAAMSEIYKQHKSEDGFLYLTYSGESTFGAL